jgi:phage-related protein
MIQKGITFGDTHTYYDLDLILSKAEVPPATPKTTYINVPGADGSIDLTEVHGEIHYSDRDCTFTFTVNPQSPSTWEEKKTEVSNLLNGRVFQITLDNDEEFYYQGRCTVDEYISDINMNQIVVTAKVKPYKYRQAITKVSATLSATPKTLTILNGRKSVSPDIECSDNNTVIVFGDTSINLNAGKHKILDIRFVEGINQVTVSGSGTVSFYYQEAEL